MSSYDQEEKNGTISSISKKSPKAKKVRKVKNSRDKFGHVKRSISIRQVKIILTRQHAKCNICKIDLNEGLEFDHILEIVDGGTNDDSNYQALCGSCHNIKTKLTEDLRKLHQKQEEIKRAYAEAHRISPYFL